MQTLTDPVNDLEAKLIAAKAGRLPLEEFFATALASQIVVMLSDPPPDDARVTDLRPLVIEMPTPVGFALVAYTSEERCRVILDQYPEYNYGLKTDTSWMLKYAPAGIGLAVNPGWDVSVGLSADFLRHLLTAHSVTEQKSPWWRRLFNKPS